MTGIIFPHNGLIKKKAAGGAGSTLQTSQLTKKNPTGVYSTLNVTNDTINTNNSFSFALALGDNPKSTGKLYFEVYFRVTAWNDYLGLGVLADDDVPSALTNTNYSSLTERLAVDGQSANKLFANDDDGVGGWDKSAVSTSFQLSGATLTGVAACAVDLDAGKLWFGYENTARTSLSWTDSGDPSAGTGNIISQNETMNVAPFLAARRSTTDGNYATLCSGSDTCKYTPPSGFSYWDAT